jgi:hypothetical protein
MWVSSLDRGVERGARLQTQRLRVLQWRVAAESVCWKILAFGISVVGVHTRGLVTTRGSRVQLKLALDSRQAESPAHATCAKPSGTPDVTVSRTFVRGFSVRL